MVHPLVISVDERLLVDLVGDVDEDLVMVSDKGVNIGEERRKALGIKGVESLLSWGIVTD